MASTDDVSAPIGVDQAVAVNDMNANNELAPNSTRRRTTLSDLPDKCLIEIFKNIPLQNLDDIIEQSPHWDKLVQEYIPVEAHLTDIGFRVALHYFVGFEQLPKYRIKVIHSRVLDETLPDLKSPEDLLILDFCTHTQRSTFGQLVKNACNLQEMYFGYSSLTGETLGEVDICMQKLKVLVMADRLVECKRMEADQMTILPRNIVGFLGKNFPSIQKLVICTVAHRHQTIEYAKHLIRFIQRHSSTLKSVKFDIRTSIYHLVQTGSIHDATEFSTTEDFNVNDLAKVQLVDLDLKFGNKFFCGLEQWKVVLENQNKLQFLNIGVEKPLDPIIYRAPVTKSAEYLKTAEIGVDVFDETKNPARTQFDCALFEACFNLELLVLSGPPITSSSVTAGRTPERELVNFEKLPKRLVFLGIDNIYLETTQINELMCGVIQKERQLQQLSLQNTGTSEMFGVTLEMLGSWIEGKALREIIVKKGLNHDETRLADFQHLQQFGITTPVAECSVHAFYYSVLMEYKRPADVVDEKKPVFSFE